MEPNSEKRKPLSEALLKELAALAEKSDEDIDFSDIPETKDEDWVNAVRGKFYRPNAQYKYKENAPQPPIMGEQDKDKRSIL